MSYRMPRNVKCLHLYSACRYDFPVFKLSIAFIKLNTIFDFNAELFYSINGSIQIRFFLASQINLGIREYICTR